MSALAMLVSLAAFFMSVTVPWLAARGRRSALAEREQVADGWAAALNRRETEVRLREWALLHAERGAT
jgi:hypothetical protein